MKDVLKTVLFGALFAIPFLTLYVENDYFFPFITGKNFWFRILVEVAFASWILLAMYDRQYRPRFSWMAVGFSALVVIMFFADLFGEYPQKSFWSNFERMDGYVTLIHVFLYFIVLGSVMTTKKLWSYFLHTTLIVAFFVALYGLGQFAGLVEGREGAGGRIDSRLGNAAYMAIYMLFHIFIAFWLFLQSRVNLYRVMYALLSVLFIFTLFYTGTRGTAVGLVVGLGTMVAYIALFGAQFRQYRKYAIGFLVVLLLTVGSFMTVRDSEFVQHNDFLRRMASISLAEMQIRFTIWNMAWEGVKERPVLGWGQGNFNYVFNKQYNPELYGQEQWFDRVHDIFFDWLIAGGILGFVAYFSILFGALYYLFWQPLFKRDEETFTVLERGVLIGLLAGYVTHNLVVFDNIISYIFYGTILALIHSRVAKDIPSVMSWRFDERLITQFAAPLVVVAIGATIYFVNVPGMQAAGDIIDAFRVQDPHQRLVYFDKAFSRNSFADQEIVEQLIQQADGVASNQNLDPEVRQEFIQRTELETLKLIDEKPGDARLHVFLASFYRSINALDQAKEQAAIARELSPNKQAIIIQQGVLELTGNNSEGARDFFKEAYELETKNTQAKELYVTTLFQTGDVETAIELIGDDQRILEQLANSNYSIGIISQSGNNDLLIKLYKIRVEKNPEDSQSWATLSYLYYITGQIDEALATLESAAEASPEFAPTAQCFSDNIKNGKTPDNGC